MIMKKIFNGIALLAVAASMLFSSCSNEVASYTPADPVSGMQVMISPEAESNVILQIDQASFTIPFLRVNDSEAANIKLKVSQTDKGIYTIPTEVVFEAGKKESEIVVKVDASKLSYGVKDTIDIAIEQGTTPYGAAKRTFIVGADQTWTNLGKCTYVDDYYFGDKAQVSIYQNDQDPALYRMPNPYIEILNAYGDPISKNASKWMYVRVLKKGQTIIGETVPEDGMVLFYGDGTANSVNTGYTNSNYNDDVCLVFPGMFTSLANPSNWMHNVVLDYKEDGSVGAVQLAPYYYMFNTGGWNATQEDGDVIIYFPGYDPKDYELDVEFKGRLIDTKENGSAIFDITLGADVASAKYLMGDGKDPLPVYYAILDESTEGVETITSSQEVKIAYAEGGDKTIVVVGFDAEGNEVGAIYTTINIPTGGGSETWTALYIGNYVHRNNSWSTSGKGVWGETRATLKNKDAVLYMSDQSESRFKIAPWIYNEMIFTMNADNTIVVENQSTGDYDEEYDTYVCATDFITSLGEKDFVSEYDEENDAFWFELVWHDEDDIHADNGAWGYTEDYFVLTGEAAEAPAKLKMCTPKAARKLMGKKGVKNHLLERDVKKFSAIQPVFASFSKQTTCNKKFSVIKNRK